MPTTTRFTFIPLITSLEFVGIAESRERARRGRGRRIDEEHISEIGGGLRLPASDVRFLGPAQSHVYRHLPLRTPAHDWSV